MSTVIGLLLLARLATRGNETVDGICGVIELLAVAAHAVAIQLGVRKYKPERRWPWHVLTASPITTVIAVIINSFAPEVNGVKVFPGPGDYLLLLALVFAMTFIFSAGYYQSPRRDRNALLDASMITTAAALMAWAFIVSPHVHSDELSANAKVALFGLPVLDVVSAFFLTRMALSGGARTPVFWSAMSATMVIIASDSAFTYLTLNHRVSVMSNAVCGFGWDIAYLLCFSVALHPSMRTFLTSSGTSSRPALSRPRLVLISVAALIAPVVALITGGANVGVWTSMLMFGLVVARMEGMLRKQESTSLTLAQTLAKLQATDVQLRHAQKQQAVGKLAAGIAHEVDPPVHAVDQNLRLLMRSFDELTEATEQYRQGMTILDDEKRRDRLKELDGSIDVEMIRDVPSVLENSLEHTAHVAKLVESIKSFGDAAAGDKRVMDLDKAIADVLAITENETRDHAMVETYFGAVHHLDASPADINEVLINLITNAAHAVQDKFNGDEAGRIILRTELDGDDAVIIVEDNGVGIRDDIQPRIFDPFFTTKGAGRGSGQGLAIVWNLIVDRHQGSIVVESQEGVGTKVTVRVPSGGKRRFERVTPRDEQLDTYHERV